MLAGMTAPAYAQEPQATFKSAVDLVTVSAAVRSGRGKVIRDLQKTDFKVFDSGVRKEIKDFDFGDTPISLAILLDISGSMAVGGNIDRARDPWGYHTIQPAQRAETKRRSSPLIPSSQEVVGFTTDLARVRALSLEGQAVGRDLALRRD